MQPTNALFCMLFKKHGIAYNIRQISIRYIERKKKILPLQIPGDLPRVLVEALRTGNASLKINDIYISIITFGSFYCYISLYTEKLEIENLKCSYYYINPYVRVGNILSLFQQSKRIFHKYNVPGRKLDINRSLLVFHLLQLCNYYLCFFY